MVRFFDGFFNKHPVWTMLMSGTIGIFIYTSYVYLNQGHFVDQNKYYYMGIGFPAWLVIRQLYWFMRFKHEHDEVKDILYYIENYDTTDHRNRVRGFKNFRSLYINSITEKLKNEEIDDDIFQMEVRSLNILGTEVELNRDLTKEEIEGLTGFDDHPISILQLRAFFDEYIAKTNPYNNRSHRA